MIDLKKIHEALTKREIPKDKPKHALINLANSKKEDFQKVFNLLVEIVDMQKRLGIPIITIVLGSKDNIDELKLYENFALLRSKVDEIKTKTTVIGKWYSLMGQTVEALKDLSLKSSEYDNFFTNLVINYDPREEIIDASRLVLRKAMAGRMDIELINQDNFKENIYSSYFLPVDLTVECGSTFSGSFLWDSIGSRIVFLNKASSNLTIQELEKII